MLTRKDFVEVARLLSGLADTESKGIMVRTLVSAFTKQNPRFDADKFKVASKYDPLRPVRASVEAPVPADSLPFVIETCRCRHTTETHAGIQGHGHCRVVGCLCRKFTWSANMNPVPQGVDSHLESAYEELTDIGEIPIQ